MRLAPAADVAKEASWLDGLLSNLVFLSMAVGYGATLVTGDLAVLAPCEGVDFALAGLYLLFAARTAACEPQIAGNGKLQSAT